MEKNYSRSIFRYVFEFYAAGFAGWIYEVSVMWIMFRIYENRGILHMPIVPIYAVGAFILLAILRKKRNPLFLFIFSAVLTTVFELGASYLLEFLFHQEFWTYETWPLSILDRSCVISSAVFGVMAVAYFWVLRPVSGWLSQKLPSKLCIALSLIGIGALSADLAISVRELIKER
ncbi:MAG TPA: putative ABC transporter permease [Ruminococcus sp.]|nr:putative ABC transporter permease [Ruminococcus sp.]